MKHIFTTLFLSFFFFNVFPQTTKIEVFINGSSIDSSGKIINVLARQDISLNIVINENKSDNFKKGTGDGKGKILNINTLERFLNNPQNDLIYYPGSNIGDINPDGGENVFAFESPFTSIKKNLDIISETNTDIITISNIAIRIPENISSGEYNLQLEHNFIGTTETQEITLLTFHYQKPQISVTQNPNSCISEKTTCDVSAVNPVDSCYILYLNGKVAKNSQFGFTPPNDTIFIDNSPLTLSFKYEDTITIRDGIYLDSDTKISADGISDTVIINENYFLKPILKTVGKDTVCQGEDINFKIENYTCFTAYTLKLFYSKGSEYNEIEDFSLSENFKFNPLYNGTLQIQVWDGTDSITSSNECLIENIIINDKEFVFPSTMRFSKNEGGHNMLNELIPIPQDADKFSYNSISTINVDGYPSNWQYMKQSIDATNYYYGRFVYEYDIDLTTADSIFDLSREDISTVASDPNTVKFFYGRYYNKYEKFCTDSTTTGVIVDRNDIFLEKESFCSDDDTPAPVIIDETALPTINVADTQRIEVKYKGYSIDFLNSTSDDDIQAGSEFDFIPREYTSGEDVSTIEIKAFAHAKIFEKTESCYDAWNPNLKVYKSNYTLSDTVIYLEKAYKCNKAYTTERPGFSTDWTFLYNCFVKFIPKEEYLTTKEEITTKEEVTTIEPIYVCGRFDSWFATPPPVIYNKDDVVSYNSVNYKCLQDATRDHVPGIYDDYWASEGTCGLLDPLLLEFDVEYASTIFNIYTPKDDGTIINLPSAYCPSGDSILLESNYTIDTLSAYGAKLHRDGLTKNFYYSFGEAYDNGFLKDTLLVSYIDNNGCKSQYIDSIFTTVDQKVAVDTTGILLWNNSDILSVLDTTFCLNSYNYELTSNNNLKVNSVTGAGIEYKDNKYYFNPGNTGGVTNTILNLQYTDLATNCPYFYNHPVELSAEYVDSTSDLLFLKEIYCAVDSAFKIQTKNTHAIDSMLGDGISYSNIYDITYNPFEALNANGGFKYSATNLTDIIDVYFHDSRNCAYKKQHIVNISGTEADQDGGLINLDTKYCKSDDSISLASTYYIDSIAAPGTYQNTLDGPWYFNPAHSDFTNNLLDESIVMHYYYKDQDNCAWFKDYPVDVYASPYAGFDLSGICYGENTQFNDTSIYMGTINNWDWDLGDGTNLSGTEASPLHQYQKSGVYPVSMKVTSLTGCSTTAFDTITIGEFPKVEFSFTNMVNTAPTEFTNQTTNPDYDPVINYTWNFDDPNSGNDIINNISLNLNHTFADIGVHNVNLQAISNNNCISDTTIKVPIFPLITVDNISTYSESFNTATSGWLASHSFDKGIPSGWKQQTVAGEFIKEPITEGMIWRTADPADNVTNEHSWVESPCFDINNLDFPLLSLDIFQSVETSRDGAVIQYSTDDGLTWELLGEMNAGVNWYNTSGIVSNPGDQVGTGNIGWSENINEWKTARFTLDAIKESGTSCIRFRVAYGSDAGNIQGITFNGFAFDNFSLTSRSRIVLLEQFVNSAYNKSEQENEELWLDQFIQNNSSEVVDLRYHNYISHDKDPLFYINPADISSRSMEYGATTGQLTMVDGIHRNMAPAYDSVVKYYNQRTLTDNNFDITVSTEKLDDNLHITANVTKKTDLISTIGSKKCVVRMAIVQKEYNYNNEFFNNVVVELLPNGEGNVVASIPEDFPVGETMEVEGTWTPNVTTIGNDFRLVVYVQGIWGVDEVHQAWFTDIDNTILPQVTVAEPVEDLVSRSKSSFNVYPTPVKEKLNIEWSETLESDVEWKLISMSGSIVKSGKTQSGQVNEVIDTNNLNEGFYLLITHNQAKLIIEKRKILIVK